jgi:hypothetical protein
MAKSKTTSSVKTYRAKPKRKRPGIHAKTKSSSHKHGRNYVKVSVGQG